MYSLKTGEILSITRDFAGCQEVLVQLPQGPQPALNYTALTGVAKPGQRVVLNTTAVELNLGSGGYHFVYLNLEQIEKPLAGDGHIIKLRYTPSQLRVQAVEEESSPHHQNLVAADSLCGMPVIVAELHSMLAPVVLTLREELPGVRIAYVMTDGGALPAFFSNTARQLRENGMLDAVITCGHAFGGDYEAVNVFSGLLAARLAAKADLAVACMGPGIAGTATLFGFSGIEVGENINRVHALGGHPVVVPRLSFSDGRSRHFGLSHHTLTALMQVALAGADLPLPVLPGGRGQALRRQAEENRLTQRHRVFWLDGLSLRHLTDSDIACSTMGRTPEQDEAFFLAAIAAGRHAACLFSGAVKE